MAPPTGGGRRILRSSPSLASLASSLSSISLYTTTSSRTQWGPGSLAGKAILALGKATVRGAEHMVISRRMATVRRLLPYHRDRNGADAHVMDGIFDDLLELSRPELYPDSIRHPAMEMILTQIACARTTYIINSVSKWLLDDLILLITEIMSVGMFCRSGFLEPRLTDAYLSALPRGRHPLEPCISFISELARQNETTFEAAILSKFLDMVLLSASQKRTISAEDVCRSAFEVLSAPPWELHEFWKINLEQYWPFDHPPSLEDAVQHINKTSPATWLILEAHFLQREARTMLELATPRKYPMHTGRSVADVTYPRMKDFTLSSVSPAFQMQEVRDSGVASSSALWHFMRCVALGADVHGLMGDHLTTQSHRSKVSLFSRIIYLLVPNTRESRLKEMQILCARLGGRKRLVHVVSKFLLDLADSDDHSKHALLDAVITLVVPFLVPEMKPTAIFEDLYSRSHLFPSIKRPPSYSKTTLALFSVIRENRLASVIGEPGSTSSQEIAEVLEPIFNF
ncbi:hypothetical protein C8R44DRAFT_883054 [Mycena epipterygia]|nr:hypothetical protein C8R44DRAFT_883054 [Mycena epipterygia]